MKVCQALAQTGAEVCLWVPGRERAEWPALAEQYGLTTPFEVRWLPSFAPLKRYDFAYQALGQAGHWGAEVIYTWLLPVAAWALRRHFATVLELHDRVTGQLGPAFFRQFVRLPGKKRLLVITQALKIRLEQAGRMGIPAGMVQIAPNGTELERYTDLPEPAEARSQLGLSQAFTAVYTGHLYPGRGTHLLIDLARALPHIQFLWVGGRVQDVAEWRARLIQEGIGNIQLTGFVANAHLPLYQAAGEVLLMPYERQIAGSSGGNSADICSPMKLFDYLAAGRVILSSDLPVLHEVLNERNAIFCPPEQSEEWVSTLQRIQTDAALCQALARQAKTDAAAYTWRGRATRALEGLG